jgi:adenylosuccinate synthase
VVTANGLNALALTKLDCLDRFAAIKVATAYDGDGNPVYRSHPGWKQPITGMTDFEELPGPCRAYIAMIEEQVQVPVPIISTGPRQQDTIVREPLW